MESPQEVDIARFELFAGCSKAELRKIRPLTTYIRVPRDTVLMREGASAHEVIIIDSGTARVSRTTDHGVATVADLGRGEILGEMGLLSGSPRTATATATTDLFVFVSSAREFEAILRIAPSVASRVARTSSNRASGLDVAA
jgi:CRP-like cAMP-binding protein